LYIGLVGWDIYDAVLTPRQTTRAWTPWYPTHS